MYWANFLHFYQPPNQQKDILERIVNESYRPLMKLFRDNPQAKVTVNINGGLLELLEENGYKDVISDINELLKRGQIEITGSAKYHAFLPFLPGSEVGRQIEINEESLRKYFGSAWVKRGFFPPELAYDFKLATKIKDLGYEWMVAAEIAFGPEKPKLEKIYQVKGLGDFKIFFRQKQASVLILSGITRSVESFFNELDANILNTNSYILTIMDAETFGHHRPGLEELLFNFYEEGKEVLQPVLVSDLSKFFPEIEKIEPRASTWSNEEQDFWLDREKKIAAKNPFLLWKDLGNPIHKLQWEFTEWAIGLVQRCGSEPAVKEKPVGLKKETRRVGELTARFLLDKALSSDQFWWASAKPWWSLEMIEAGAYELKKVVEAVPGTSEEDQTRAEVYYHQILKLAFEWQRTGKIRQAHKEIQGEWKGTPFKERAPAEWYNQIILEFEDEMKKAAEKQEFEKAIKWRDAIIKLKSGMDVYDVLHVVDELYSVRKIPSVKPFLEHKEEEFSDFAKKHFLSLDKQGD